MAFVQPRELASSARRKVVVLRLRSCRRSLKAAVLFLGLRSALLGLPAFVLVFGSPSAAWESTGRSLAALPLRAAQTDPPLSIELDVSEPISGKKRAKLLARAREKLLAVRRRWGLAMVQRVVSIVVRLELMAVRDPKEVAVLLSDTLEATRRGITDFTGSNEYKFGDISKAAFSKFSTQALSRVSNYTGKDDYEFGDLSKATIAKFTQKDEYEFGDVSKAAVSKLTDSTKATVKQITGKDEYVFGDLARAAMAKLTGGNNNSS
ncbi:unnamed protein product [Polarella glacialis]|uniref:Uncharacterized protein n=1 Tax=Polarella glacialis TaxID=89957 RepID=A0A813L382_POLGL|nr:unnamed protein product [Polarella glacialis]CAE8718454.1 unnamed protein product [Polarella glacialis]